MQDKPKYREDKPIFCRYCYWWNDLKRQCGLKQCHYQIKTKKKMEDVSKNRYGDCNYCQYGKHAPCIGFCILKLRKEVKSRL